MDRRLRFWVGLLVVAALPLMACARYYRAQAPDRGGALLVLAHPAVLVALILGVLAWSRRPVSRPLRLLATVILLGALGFALLGG